jgi:hypothetical protein
MSLRPVSAQDRGLPGVVLPDERDAERRVAAGGARVPHRLELPPQGGHLVVRNRRQGAVEVLKEATCPGRDVAELDAVGASHGIVPPCGFLS